MVLACMVIAILVALNGCSSIKQKIAVNYYAVHKDQLAATCQSNFPQTPAYIEGKDSIRFDTTYETHFITDRDTNIIKNVITPARTKIITITKLRVDTLKLPDNSKLFSLQVQLAHNQDQLNTVTAAYQRYRKLLWWFIGACALCLLETYVLIRNVSFIQFFKSFFV